MSSTMGDEFVQWLSALGLDSYEAAFARHRIGFDALPHLREDDFAALGLPLGPRRLLQAAIAQRRPDAGCGSDDHAARMAAPGERRQITVMFCDLVGSTALSARLDLEDLRSLMHAYYSSCCKRIEEGGGFIARVVGDGVLAYFGYPAAREDAAECAIRAALDILRATRAERVRNETALDVRIGLATGVTVVSEMIGRGFAEPHAVLGQTPNLAARVQASAAPGTVVVSDETRRLAGRFFEYEDHGSHALKGFDTSVQLWRVVGERATATRFDAQRMPRGECIGRQLEMGALQASWTGARSRRCRVVTVRGEAGIGKSRLLRLASEQLAPAPGFRALLQCSPSRTTSPLHPVIEWLRRDIGLDSSSRRTEDRVRAWLGDDVDAAGAAVLAELMAAGASPDGATASLPPERKRELMRQVVVRCIERRCASGGGLLLVEDAHWMDGASKAFLASVLQGLRDAPLLAIVTTRPSSEPAIDTGEDASIVHLGPLHEADALRLVRSVCGDRTLPEAVVRDILSKTDGVPLYIEELAASVLEASALDASGRVAAGHGPAADLGVPATLRDSLLARLDRLGGTKEIVQAGSVIGREFGFTLLSQVAGRPAERLIPALDRLVEAQLLFQRGTPPHAEYTFKHALLQQAAYDMQLRGARQALHARVVAAIEAHHPRVAERDPGWMAHHCHLAGLVDREVDYLLAAGRLSTRLVAIQEALSYFARADEACARLEPTRRNVARQIEIILGMMEVGRFAILPSRLRELSARAHALSRTDGLECAPGTRASILFQDGRARVYSTRYAEARDIFREIRRMGLAQGAPDIERKPASAFVMGLCCQGLFNETLAFMSEGHIEHYRASGSFIDVISGLGWMGYAGCETAGEAGLEWGERSVHEARVVQSPIYLGGAHVWRSHALMALRRLDEAIADAQACVEVSETHGVPYLGWHGLVFLALCQSRGGAPDAAARSLERARALLAKVEDGCWSLLDYLPAIEAEIARGRGDHAAAIAWSNQAIALAGGVGGHFAQAIAYRVKALSWLSTGGPLREAQALFDAALERHRLGCARAEHAFSALVWARALHDAGQERSSKRWIDEAGALARAHGFELARCEYRAAPLRR